MNSAFSRVLADATVPGRPGTEPALTSADFDIMQTMLARLFDTSQACSSGARVSLEESDGRPHQVVLVRSELLTEETLCVVVGFFGAMRAGAEAMSLAHVCAVDEALIGEFPHHDGVVSYSSMRLLDRNWANLAVFSDMQAMEAWNRNPRHALAVRHLAPRHYESIRLHVGWLRHRQFQPWRSKFYHFEPESVWRGIRQHKEAGRCPFSP